MIARTMFAISMEESRFTLNGALLLLQADSMTMVATDGHRLAYVQRPSGAAGQREHFLSRWCRAKRWERSPNWRTMAAEARLRFAGDENHLFFELGPRLLITRKLTGNFPDYDRVLPQENTHIATLSKDEIKSAIERVAQFADERSRAIRVQFIAGEVKVFSSSLETGESEESVPGEYTGPDLEIGFNAQYLLDFLRAIPQNPGDVQSEGPEERRRAAALAARPARARGRTKRTRRKKSRSSIATWSCPCGYDRF